MVLDRCRVTAVVHLRPSGSGGQPSPGLPTEARAASEGWSGRRGSNPRPTAWKAVTLPLSYSRLRATPLSQRARSFSVAPPSPSPACAADRARSRPDERKLVAREGLEPSKPLGRQIYSLLRLTASLPRQLVCVMETRAFGAFLFGAFSFGAYPDAGAVGRWSWRRDLNPRPADYKSAALPD